MKDLTRGSIVSHILGMAPPIVAGMITIMICQLVDLYFVAGLGEAAVAGVAAASNAGFLINGLMQVLGVGTVALMAHAVGRKDRADANLIFNQSVVLSVLCGLLTLVAGSVLARFYMRAVAADEATVEAGTTYLLWFMPALALQFVMQAMAAALRATGIVRPSMLVQVFAVVINIALAPVLISGWGTGHAFGVAGAGLASSIAVLIGVLMLFAYFRRFERYVRFEPKQWRPQFRQWRRILNVGLPAGGEFALMFLYTAIVYGIIRDFGATAQAGFGMGSRIMQAVSLPAMAIAFATAPVVGQNFGAGHGARVRATFRTAIVLGAALMLVLTLLCQIAPAALLRGFTNDAAVIAIGAQFLQIVSWNFAAAGIVFTCSGLFQALGNTWPALLSSAARLLGFALPVTWLARRPHFRIAAVWYLSVASVVLQAVLSYTLARRQLRRTLLRIHEREAHHSGQ